MSMFQNKQQTYATQGDDSGDDTVETVVGPSVTVEGDFASEGNIIVKGTVSGNVTTSRLLSVEEGARIFANVKAGTAVIAGSIKGNVKVESKLELTETAQILGDIVCRDLEVESGALIQGKVTMDGINIDGDKSEKKKPTFGRSKSRSTKKIEDIDTPEEDESDN